MLLLSVLSLPFLLPLILLNLLATVNEYGTILNQYISLTVTIFNVALCMLLHLLYNPTHALFTL